MLQDKYEQNRRNAMLACKIIERKNLPQYEEKCIYDEIRNQKLSQSAYVVNIIKTVKTD